MEVGPDVNGVATVLWDFDNASDYTVVNASLDSGNATLSLHETVWSQSSFPDFMNGSVDNLDVLSAGEIKLSLIPATQLLGNGNFTNPDDGIQQTVIDNWTCTSEGDAMAPSQLREVTGGLGDDLYCWGNCFKEWDASGYYNIVWLNQTFNLTSVPLSINVSAFHNFQNNSYAISPGNIARVIITNLGSMQNYTIYDSGMLNASYADYVPISWTDTDIFSEPGLYNLTLYTYTDSGGKPADIIFPNGIYNYWDNISIEYTAHIPAGTYVSPVFDTGSYAMWKDISWSETLPYGTDIEMFVRTGNSSVPTDSIWSAWSAPLTDVLGSSIDRPWGRYVQYRAELTTQYTNVTPVLREVNITYDKYHLTGSLETRDFLPAKIVRWGYFSYVAAENGQAASFEYSTDSGVTWIDMRQDNDLREVPITASGIRLKTTLGTSDTVVTPVLANMSVNYTTTFPSLGIEQSWESGGASPGETARLYIHFNNTASSISATAWLNVYLDDRLEYIANNTQTISTFDSFISDTNQGTQKYVFSKIPEGNNVFWIDAKVRPGTGDGDILQTTATLEYLGPLGKRVGSLLSTAPLRVDGPVLAANIVALNTTGDVGDAINYEIHVNNTGLGMAAKVWVNGTLDDRFSGQNISLVLENITGESSSIIPINVTLKENVVQGSSIPMKVTLHYADTAGFRRVTESNREIINALLRSRFDLSLLSQAETVNSSDMVVLTIFFNNSGYGSAESVHLEFIIPEGLEFLSSSEECLVFSGKCYWDLDNVGTGTHSFTLTLRAKMMDEDMYRTDDFFITMQVTDPVDGERPAVASNNWSIDINRIYTAWEKIYWPWSGIAAAAIITVTAFGLWYVFKPTPPSIDDAFVLYKDGRLISHRRTKNKPKSELDGDLVGAMLTAVQQFISDSLSEGGEGKVKKLEFGDQELFLERGTNINIALIYSGSMNKKLQAQVQELMVKIETDHPNLVNWDGRMSVLGDIHAQVDTIVESWQTPRSD